MHVLATGLFNIEREDCGHTTVCLDLMCPRFLHRHPLLVEPGKGSASGNIVTMSPLAVPLLGLPLSGFWQACLYETLIPPAVDLSLEHS